MPSAGTKDLFWLVKSLTKSEKGFLKVYIARRSPRGDNLIYLRIFERMERQDQGTYDEKALIRETGIKPSRLPNLKNYLSGLILQSLRELYSKHTVTGLIRGWIADAEILYKKALYKQARKIITRVKHLAYAHEKWILLLEILHWERRLVTAETYTYSLDNQLTSLIDEEKRILSKLSATGEYKALSEKIFVLLKKYGEPRNMATAEEFRKILRNPLLKTSDKSLPVEARYYLYFILANLYYGLGDKQKDYIYRKKIVELSDSSPEWIRENTEQYTGQLNNLLISQTTLRKYAEILSVVKKLRALPARSVITQANIFASASFYELNVYIDTGDFAKGIPLIPGIEKELLKYSAKINKAKELLLYYNCACIYFGTGEYNRALHWLNKILNDTPVQLRQDLYCVARVLSLIIHLELHNISLLEYSVKSTYHFLYKQKMLYRFEALILDFIRKKIPKIITRPELVAELRDLKEKLVKVSEDPFEKKALDYFNFIAWIDSKIEGRSFAEMVKRKVRKNY